MRLFTLSILFVITVLIIAFDAKKCEHVFTQVEQATLKIERIDVWQSAIYTEPLTGLHEGMELICVKCFHRQKQVVDYGTAPSIPNSALINIDTFKLPISGFIKIDSSNNIYWDSIIVK